MNVSELVHIQNELSKKVVVKKLNKVPKLIAGFDLSFLSEKRALAVGLVLRYPSLEMIELKWTTADVDIPYIPGLLSFREGPALEKVYSMLKSEPDLLFFDGQGIAHPRGIGLASHMGVLLSKPSIGVAKSHLYGSYVLPKKIRGGYTYLTDGSRKIGVVVTTKNKVKPLFVSPGNYVNLTDCVHYTLSTCKGYKLPEPTRLADMYTKSLKKEVRRLEKR